jgi:sporulation protein YlmC with PRC-barrel domain
VESKDERKVVMAETTQFTIGADVSCSDGVCGEVSRVVIDPVAREFDKLDHAEESCFLPGTGGHAGYDPEHVLSWPYYGLGGMGIGTTTDLGIGNASQPVTYDTLPLGEVSVRRGDQVHATDGDIGRVQGIVIDPRNHQVTHVLLQEGHLWGSRDVAIPIRALTVGDNGIALNITKQQVQDLPPVDIDHASG